MTLYQSTVPRIPGTMDDLLQGERIRIDDHITFAVRYNDFKPVGTGYLCSLSGEFLKDGMRFEPPQTYTLTNVRVMFNDIASLVRPAYGSQLQELRAKLK